MYLLARHFIEPNDADLGGMTPTFQTATEAIVYVCVETAQAGDDCGYQTSLQAHDPQFLDLDQVLTHEFGRLKCYLRHVGAGYTQLAPISSSVGCTMTIAASTHLPQALSGGGVVGAATGTAARLPDTTAPAPGLVAVPIAAIAPSGLWSGTSAPLATGAAIWTDQPTFSAKTVPFILEGGTGARADT